MKKTIITLIAGALAILTLLSSCAGSEPTSAPDVTAARDSTDATAAPNTADTPYTPSSAELIFVSFSEYSAESFYTLSESPDPSMTGESFQRDDAPAAMEINDIFGFTGTGHYCESYRSPAYRSDSDRYWMDLGFSNTRASWDVNTDSGRIMSLHIDWGNYVDQGRNLSFEECAAIARDTLSQLGGNTDYEMDLSAGYGPPLNAPGVGVFYRIVFERKIGGVPTEETTWVDVNTDGRICSYQTNGREAFEGLDVAALGAKIQAINDGEAIRERIKELCVSGRALDISVSDRKVWRRRDGVPGIMYTVQVSPAGDSENFDMVTLFRPME